MIEERIVLTADQEPAVRAVAGANRALEGYEKSAERAARSVGINSERVVGGVVRVAHQSSTQIERFVSSIEKRAEMAGKTGVERIMAQRDLAVRRVAGDPAAVDRITKAYERLAAVERERGEQAGRLQDVLRNPWEAAKTAVGGFVSSLGTVGVVIGAVAAGTAVLGKQMFDLVASEGAAAEETGNLAARLGVTSVEAYKLQSVAGLAGVSVNALEGGAVKLAQALADSTGEGKNAAAALDRLGVRTITASGEQRELGQVVLEVIERLSRIDNAAQRAALAQQLLGRGGKELIPLVNAYRELGSELEEMGLILDARLLARLDRADDQIGKLGLAWRAFKAQLAEAIEPIVVPVVVKLTNALSPSKLTRQDVTADPEGAILREELGRFSGPLARPPVPNPAQEMAIESGEAMRQHFLRRREASLEGIAARLKNLREERTKLDSLLAQSGMTDVDRRIREQELGALDRDIANLESRKKNIEEATRRAEQRTEEQRRLAERGWEIIRRRQASEAAAGEEIPLFGGGTARAKPALREGDPGFVQPVKLDDQNEALRRAQQRFEQRQQLERQTLEIGLSMTREALDFELESIELRKRAQLAALETVSGRTAADKIAIEEAKLQIERQFIQESLELKAAKLEREKQMELEQLDFERALLQESLGWKMATLAPDAEIEAAFSKFAANASMRGAILERYGQLGSELMERTAADIQETTARGHGQIARIVESEYEKTYEAIKRGFEETFDALITRTRSWGDVLKSILTAAILTPVKQAAASWFASLFAGGAVRTQMRTMQPAGLVAQIGGGAGSLMGFGSAPALGGFGSLLPIFGGTARPTAIDYARLGMTPPFLPGSGGPLTAPTILQGTGGIGFGGVLNSGQAFAGYGNQFLGALARLGNLGRTEIPIFGGGTGTTGPGVYGTAGGAMMLGGASLAAAGLYRGGLSGLGMTAAGGALIGAKFGGPVGAVIGAIAGAGAGLIRMFIKGAEEKCIEKVRARYGITIDKSFAKTLVAEAKSFGGLDLFLGTERARELIYLYGEMTNQGNRALDNKPRGVNLEQRDGTVYQTGSFIGGQGYTYGGAIRDYGNLGRFETPSTAGSTATGGILPWARGIAQPPATVIQNAITVVQRMDGPTTERTINNFLRDGIIGNPDAVQIAAIAATAASVARTPAAANLMDPLATRI